MYQKTARFSLYENVITLTHLSAIDFNTLVQSDKQMSSRSLLAKAYHRLDINKKLSKIKIMQNKKQSPIYEVPIMKRTITNKFKQESIFCTGLQ